ncbi:hypothetical protein HII36_04595 [Nonomuraea sp. NN258]|uniref:hypothetical protein n=1 Tax=Nonomuraea antri TaxID=2730852 RepID=UPI0015689AD3|nr:hypothetical protein [Nonomuraea antri]NRQ31114.1 hypothetical protein [Nonomuraea antri]
MSSSPLKTDALIFPGARGGILRRTDFLRAAKWNKTIRKIGVPGRHFHDLPATRIPADSGKSFRRAIQWHVNGTKPRFRDRKRG